MKKNLNKKMTKHLQMKKSKINRRKEQTREKKQIKKFDKKDFLFYFGNTLIVISLLFFAIIFTPIILMYISPPKSSAQTTPSKTGFSIEIPKIHAESNVIENVDPWNETAYRAALKKGVAQAKGTSLPGQNGTIYLFAHSSGPPWEITRYNTIFLRLDELIRGDKIILDRNGKEFDYIVRGEETVWPNDIAYLLDHKKNQLILQTCTPIGTDWQRLLVFADPVK